jgi:hypothetical protein
LSCAGPLATRRITANLGDVNMLTRTSMDWTHLRVPSSLTPSCANTPLNFVKLLVHHSLSEPESTSMIGQLGPPGRRIRR